MQKNFGRKRKLVIENELFSFYLALYKPTKPISIYHTSELCFLAFWMANSEVNSKYIIYLHFGE